MIEYILLLFLKLYQPDCPYYGESSEQCAAWYQDYICEQNQLYICNDDCRCIDESGWHCYMNEPIGCCNF